MSPELELLMFMTPIFTDKAELALEVFKPRIDPLATGQICMYTVVYGTHTVLSTIVQYTANSCHKLYTGSDQSGLPNVLYNCCIHKLVLSHHLYQVHSLLT